MIDRSLNYVPADVPKSHKKEYLKNYAQLTRNTGRTLLFAADQKVEHLNIDFVGPTLDPSIADPEHIFKIASEGSVGALATQLGLIAQYGMDYSSIAYVVKLTGKTNLIPEEEQDPMSSLFWTTEDVIELKKKSGLNICAIGLTIYIGSSNEGIMLAQAAREIFKAHQHGLVTFLWIYPRGKAVNQPNRPELIAGASGIASCLSTDFVKVNPPEANIKQSSAQLLKEATIAAGRTKVICSGGQLIDPKIFLENLYKQIHVGQTGGCAVGRNIFQRPIEQAIQMTKAISQLVYENKTVEDVMHFFKKTT